MRGRLTISINPPTLSLNHFAEMRPSGEVIQVKADIVCFCQMVEIAGIELQKVHRGHGPDGGHLEG